MLCSSTYREQRHGAIAWFFHENIIKRESQTNRLSDLGYAGWTDQSDTYGFKFCGNE